MGYYIRVLGISDPDIHVDQLISALSNDGLTAKFQIDEDERPETWTVLEVGNADGETIMEVERNPVVDGKLGQDEIEEFLDEISECEPKSAVKWLEIYFQKVKVIYAFRLLGEAMEDSNYSIVSSVRTAIWSITGGILQADNEGFSNEDGYHILWQFDDNVTGEWNMAVRTLLGRWANYKMELGNPVHRVAFKAGKVPKEI